MNKFGREVTIEILVGLFMFIVLIALGIFTIVLSRENFLKQSYQYEFVFTEISGLREGDNVYLRGMNVGRVQQTTLDDSNVRVHVTLDVPIRLRRGYKIDIVNASMLGGKFLKIYEGPEDAAELGENVTILGAAPADVIEELSSAVSGLQAMINSVSEGQGTLGKLLNDDTMYDNMVTVSEDLKRVVDRLANGKSSLGRLLSEDDSLYQDFSATIASLKNVSAGLESGEGTLGKLLQDEAVYTDVKAVMANLHKISDSVANGEGTIGKLMVEDSSVFDDLQASMAAVRSISESIEAGEGTMGRLVKDAELYDEATLLVEDVRAAVDDLREASPITSFGSVLFGAF
jgi:phospholipid/cholesterol/gamma-HCH transport system substrate-binding protein